MIFFLLICTLPGLVTVHVRKQIPAFERDFFYELIIQQTLFCLSSLQNFHENALGI